MFHKDDELGWVNCNDCGKLVHHGCVMAFNSYEINENEISCKQCIMKRGPEATHVGDSNIQAMHLVASDIQATHLSPSDIKAIHVGASNIRETPLDTSNIEATHVEASDIQAAHAGGSFPMADSMDWSELESCGSFTELLIGGAFLAEPGRATIEGHLDISEQSNSDLIFLFEKKLTPTDCDVKAGRFLVPKKYAEKYFPEVVGSNTMPFLIEDTQARSWPFTFRWWTNKNSRKYVLDNTRQCIEEMKWTAGNNRSMQMVK